jgi:hypothetical protein
MILIDYYPHWGVIGCTRGEKRIWDGRTTVRSSPADTGPTMPNQPEGVSVEPERRGRPGERRRLGRVLRILGPGLVTGAADDDPSGIATHSQSGAQFGFGTLWVRLLTLPLPDRAARGGGERLQ